MSRQRFTDACRIWCERGLEHHFIKGFDDRQCGRAYSLGYPGGTLAGDAYRAGWDTYEIPAGPDALSVQGQEQESGEPDIQA